MGLNDRSHPPSDKQAPRLQIIRWFQTTGGAAYIGGTPAFWRSRTRDANADPAWDDVYKAMDVVQPWNVGRYGDLAGVDRWKTEQIVPDLALTASNGQLYMPVIFPGFSWHNLESSSPKNQIPRLKGEFLWKQAVNARSAGVRIWKIAMFDEVNEGTAMSGSYAARKRCARSGLLANPGCRRRRPFLRTGRSQVGRRHYQSVSSKLTAFTNRSCNTGQIAQFVKRAHVGRKRTQ